MTTLISSVGNSDPIRNFHDGPILHLARVKKPSKIVLVHSELTIVRHDVICHAIQSIPDYDPEIISHHKVILNKDIFLFDEMFNQLNEIIKYYYSEEDDIILNLSSGTPQTISALFSINRIHDYNVKAYQVVSPNKSSNAGIVHENPDDIDVLIETNLDNEIDFENRLIKDKGETFSKVLLRYTMTDLIKQYDYPGVFQISIKNSVTSKSKRKKVNKKLQELVDFVSYQKLLPDIEESKLNDREKVLLNAALIIDLQSKRSLTSEVLIRIQNLAEKIIEYYLSLNYSEFIVSNKEKTYLNIDNSNDIIEYINNEFSKRSDKKDSPTFNPNQYLGLPTYLMVLEYLEKDKEIVKHIHKINAVRHNRNIVAHNLKEIEKNFDIQRLTNICWSLLEEVMIIDAKWYSYFEDTNNELIEYIHS